MGEIDFEYLLSNASSLCGVPVSVFEKGVFSHCLFPSPFPVCPAGLAKEDVESSEQKIGFRFDRFSSYYVFFKSGSSLIVFGPSRETPFRKEEAREMAFSLGVKPLDAPSFWAALSQIQPMPLSPLLLSCCSLYHVLTSEKADVSNLFPASGEGGGKMERAEDSSFRVENHSSSYRAEREMLSFVKRGDVRGLEEWVSSLPSFRPGETSNEEKSQSKNLFIITASLACRAAIEGGLDPDLALSLSDTYLKRNEALPDSPTRLNLQLEMLRDYASRVSLLAGEQGSIRLALSNYAERHFGESFTLKKVAKSLSLSESSLCACFGKESKGGVIAFLKDCKLRKAAQLLKDGDSSVSEISYYLGYPTAALFCRNFKKKYGVTPSGYREKEKKA